METPNSSESSFESIKQPGINISPQKTNTPSTIQQHSNQVFWPQGQLVNIVTMCFGTKLCQETIFLSNRKSWHHASQKCPETACTAEITELAAVMTWQNPEWLVRPKPRPMSHYHYNGLLIHMMYIDIYIEWHIQVNLVWVLFHEPVMNHWVWPVQGLISPEKAHNFTS